MNILSDGVSLYISINAGPSRLLSFYKVRGVHGFSGFLYLLPGSRPGSGSLFGILLRLSLAERGICHLSGPTIGWFHQLLRGAHCAWYSLGRGRKRRGRRKVWMVFGGQLLACLSLVHSDGLGPAAPLASAPLLSL